MYRVYVMRFSGAQQEIASCLNHIPWTMKELGTKRAIVTEVSDEDHTCMACLKQVDITLVLPTVKSGEAAHGS